MTFLSARPYPAAAFCRRLALLLFAAAALVNAPVRGQVIVQHPPAAIHTPENSQKAMRAFNAFEVPLNFEPAAPGSTTGPGTSNTAEGQAAPRYVAHAPGYSVALRPSQTSIELLSGGKIDLHFVGGNKAAAIRGAEPLHARHSYFASPDGRNAMASVPMYGRVNYDNLYPGIDVSFYGRAGRLEYDLVLSPGADPRAVTIALNGAEQARVDENGDLRLTANGSTMKLLKPVAYQQIPGGKDAHSIAVHYLLRPADAHTPALLSFAVDPYDRTQPLTIDPVLIAGGSIPGLFPGEVTPYSYGDAFVTAMALDGADNIYVATTSPYNDGPLGVLKFSPAGELLLNVSLGSSQVVAKPRAIAVDQAGDIYLGGSANPGLPTTPGAFQPTGPSAVTAFLTVVKADGSSLLYSTYLGGTGGSDIVGLALDSGGRAYVTGSAQGNDFPTTPGAYASAASASTYQTTEFIAKLDPSKSGTASLVYSTYVEANSQNITNYSTGGAIAVDKAGNAYVAATASPGYPVTPGAYAFEGIDDQGAYVTKLSADGSALIYSAFLGPGVPTAAALDASGAMYITGSVSSAEFPTTPGAYQAKYPSGFASKLSPDGSSLIYSTFLGGPNSGLNDTAPTAIALVPDCASACIALVSGTDSDTGLPLINAIQTFRDSFPPGQEPPSFNTGFLVGLAADGKSALLSSYLGAATTPTSWVGGLALDSSGNIYFAANVAGPDAPVTLPVPEDAGGGYILKIGLASAGSAVALPGNFAVPAPQAVRSTGKIVGAIQLRNMGSEAFTLQRPFVSSSKEFVESDNCGTTLAGGGICLLDLSFTPSASGTRSGTLTIHTSAPNSPAVVSLNGTGIDEPLLAISTTALNFGDQLLNSATPAQTVTLTNSGDQAQPLVGITVNLPDFKLSGNCPAQLAAQSSCVLKVQFAPTQVGLRSDSLFIQLPGYVYLNGYPYPNGYFIPLTGTGVLSATGTGTLRLSANGLNFGSVLQGSPAQSQTIAVLNTGDVPVTINSIAGATTQGGAADFSVQQISNQFSDQCGSNYNGGLVSFPYEIAAQSSCAILINFTPSTAGQEMGTVTVSSSAAGAPLVASLSGVGLHSVQALSVLPGNLVFPAQPVGDPSAPQTFTITNGGEDSVVLDRALASGDFAIDEVANSTCEGATLGPQSSCTLSIVFSPTAVGARTGTLTLIDTLSGNPQVFNLAGASVQATGTLALSTTSLTFISQPQGSTSSDQELIVSNPGNSPVTINSVIASGDFALDRPYYASSCVGRLAPAATCSMYVVFSPTKSSGQETGLLTLRSTAGTLSVNLTGTPVAAKQSLQITASSLSFGTVMAGAQNFASNLSAYIDNTGNEPVTFLAPPVISAKVAADAADFTFYACPNLPSTYQAGLPLPAGASCQLSLSFTPSRQGKESATLTLVDSAGTHTVALSGTGAAAEPAVSLSPATLSFDQTVVGASSYPYFNFGMPVTLTNNGTQPITVASITVTAGSSDFSINQQYFPCTGQTVYPGSYCTAYVLFTPSVAGYRTGAVTFVDGNGVDYVVAVAGYGEKEVNRTSLLPQAVLLPSVSLAAANSPFAALSNVVLQNTGNTAITVGTISGTNVSSTGDFSITYPAGQDSCSGSTVQPGGSCQVTVAFTPRAIGTRTGTLVFPVTYADASKGSLTATLSGVALANQDAATLVPQTVDFASLVEGGQSSGYATQLTLTNSGTVTLTLGTIAGTNLNLNNSTGADFSLAFNGCYQTLAPGATCNLGVSFAPVGTGLRTGSVIVPLTYADGQTATLTAALSGNAAVPAPALLITPSSLAFNVEVAGTTDYANTRTTALISAGNAPVVLTSVTASPNFTVSPSNCGTTLSSYSPCYETVSFAPLATTPPGPVTGTLTIVDNAPGSPHVVALSGTVVSVAQELAVSQTSVSFGSLALNSASAPQAVYLTDLAPSGSSAQVNSIKLGGVNAADFIETQDCGGSLGFSIDGRQSCAISIAFAPGAHSAGTRTASVTITPAAGAPLVVQLIGNGVASAAKAAAH